jgi:hypothetical protein
VRTRIKYLLFFVAPVALAAPLAVPVPQAPVRDNASIDILGASPGFLPGVCERGPGGEILGPAGCVGIGLLAGEMPFPAIAEADARQPAEPAGDRESVAEDAAQDDDQDDAQDNGQDDGAAYEQALLESAFWENTEDGAFGFVGPWSFAGGGGGSLYFSFGTEPRRRGAAAGGFGAGLPSAFGARSDAFESGDGARETVEGGPASGGETRDPQAPGTPSNGGRHAGGSGEESGGEESGGDKPDAGAPGGAAPKTVEVPGLPPGSPGAGGPNFRTGGGAGGNANHATGGGAGGEGASGSAGAEEVLTVSEPPVLLVIAAALAGFGLLARRRGG